MVRLDKVGYPYTETDKTQRKRDSAYNSTRKRARARATIAASPRCENCGATTDLTADHLIPVIDGGAGGPLRVLCRSCNSARGARL